MLCLAGGFHGTLDRQGKPISPTNKFTVQQVCVRVPSWCGLVARWNCWVALTPATNPTCELGCVHATQTSENMHPSPSSPAHQARHLWAFSSLLTAQKSAGQTWGLNSKDVRAAADSAYSFMRKYMLRDVEGGERGSGALWLAVAAPHTGGLLAACGVLWALKTIHRAASAAGKLFVYSTTREGQAANSDLNIYANSFAIYGLSAYALATGSTEVRELALSTFKTLDKLYHSPNGGYDETTSGCTLDSIALNPAQNSAVKSCSGTLGVSPSRASGSRVTEEAGSKQQQPPLSQSFNTLLHIAEALTELSKATGGSDPTVTARLLEVLQLQTGPMVIRPRTKGANTPAAYIAPNYDPRSWSPVGGFYTNYGHNIEAAWLLNDAVDELQAKGGIESAKAAAMRAVLTDIGEAAVAAGYDNTNGGL